MYSVYILYSSTLDGFYKGQTSNLGDRLNRHMAGRERSTKSGVPWRLMWSTEKETREEALALEKKLKHLRRDRLISFMQKYKEGIAGPDEFLLLEKLSGC